MLSKSFDLQVSSTYIFQDLFHFSYYLVKYIITQHGLQHEISNICHVMVHVCSNIYQARKDNPLAGFNYYSNGLGVYKSIVVPSLSEDGHRGHFYVACPVTCLSVTLVVLAA